MTRYSIAKIEQEANARSLPLEKALRKVATYIIKKIDKDFPVKEFLDWCDSDSEKPFRSHGNIYHWD